VIDRIIIYADTTWSVGELDATLRGVVTAEALRSDARTGSEPDSIAVELPITVSAHFNPPPLGRQCDVIQGGETLVSGTITEIAIAGVVRLTVDL
jgi:hypothetical protein